MTGEAKLVVILGPTASGKSELALRVARQTGAEILSVDSMQVYRGMDIGTAKPTQQEQQDIKHHLIDVVEPNQEFTAARFVELADEILASGKKIILTGGTPLYYKSLFEGLFEGPPANAELRKTLRELTGQQLHEKLRNVDTEAAQRIHANDTKRLIRALEVFELTGKPITEHQKEWGAGKLRHHATWIGLCWDKEIVNQRINLRVKQMIAAGWLDEVRGLLERYGELSKTAGEATGYAQLIRHLRGQMSLEDAIEETKIGTRQLARRQMKWFRRFAQVNWIEGSREIEDKLAETVRILGM
ncbi:MAG TPA: tRNA (adenosine(37)-N6)-dimethylallyltransferase MiaA [Tepidisphaeraceae bacterium]